MCVYILSYSSHPTHDDSILAFIYFIDGKLTLTRKPNPTGQMSIKRNPPNVMTR